MCFAQLKIAENYKYNERKRKLFSYVEILYEHYFKMAKKHWCGFINSKLIEGQKDMRYSISNSLQF